MANRDTEVDNLIINELTKAEFDSTIKSETELYFVTDEKITIEDIDNLQNELNNKQDLLASGTNIKTINGESIVGSGNVEIKTGETITMSYDETNQRLIFGKEIN